MKKTIFLLFVAVMFNNIKTAQVARPTIQKADLDVQWANMILNTPNQGNLEYFTEMIEAIKKTVTDLRSDLTIYANNPAKSNQIKYIISELTEKLRNADAKRNEILAAMHVRRR